MARNPNKAIILYFGVLGMIVAVAAFLAPFVFDQLVAQDKQKLLSLAGTAGGISVVLLVGGLLMGRKRG